MTFYVKIDTITKLDEVNSVVGINGVSVVVPHELISSTGAEAAPDFILQALTDIRLSTRAIEHWVSDTQAPDLSTPLPSSTAQPVDNSREREAGQPRPVDPQPQPDLVEKSDQLFQVNEEVTPTISAEEWSYKVNEEYMSNPKTRRSTIKKVAGMVRLDMLKCKDMFCRELRQAVVGSILRRDALNTALVPPDLAAFLDDRPLNDTLGSRGWDPGSDHAKDSVSPNWAASQAAQDTIAKTASNEEFAHMYASTEEMDIGSVTSNAKNLFGSKS